MSERIKQVKKVKPVNTVRKTSFKVQNERLIKELKELSLQADQVERAYDLTVSNLRLRIDWYNLLPWYVKVWEAFKGAKL